MNELGFALAEKIIKIIMSVLLGNKDVISASDISSLCINAFKRFDSRNRLALQTPINDATLRLNDEIEHILEKTDFSEDAIKRIKEQIISAIDSTDWSSKALISMRYDAGTLNKQFIENCKWLGDNSQAEEDIIRKCLNYAASSISSVLSPFDASFQTMNFQAI